MKKYLFIIITVLAVFYGCRSSKLITTNNIFVFKPVGLKTNSTLETVHIFLRIDTVQKESIKGIQFSIKLENNSDSAIAIKNPLDFTYIQLIDESGVNIVINQPSRYKIHSNGIEDFSYKAFNIDHVLIDSKSSNIMLSNEKVITIPSKGTYEIFLNILNVMKNKSSNQIGIIAKGKYSFSIMVNLVNGKEPTTLDVKAINIKYGQL